jgi:hypothetical protein
MTFTFETCCLTFILSFPLCYSAIRSKATLARGSFKDFDKKTWTSDPGAYPIIVILAFAVTASAAYINYKVFWDNDVRFDPKKRGSVVRFWG